MIFIRTGNWNKLFIKNKAGLQLSTLTIETPGDTIVVVCHGFTGSKEGGGRALEMGEALAGKGLSTVLFDFAGCGDSEGQFEDISLTGHTDDLESVVTWCRQKNYSNIILNGRSFGGSTAIKYASRDSDIKAVCTWAAVTRLEELFNKFASQEITGPPDQLSTIHGDEGTVYLKNKFFYDLKQHNLLKASAKLDLQGMLIIHGSADESVPVKDAHLLYEAAPEPKELAVIDGADHRFSDHIDQVWDRFFTWLVQLTSK